jgi:predicted MFS family arabinose efflux permease
VDQGLVTQNPVNQASSARATPAIYSTLPLTAWTAVALLWFSGGSNYLTRTTLTTMRGSIVADIPMTDAQFGLLTSAFLWIYAAASPFCGFFADRFSRRMVVIVSLVLWSTITIATAQVRSFEPFLLLRALLGLSQAFYIPAAVAIVVDYHLGPTRALAGGIHLTGMVFGNLMSGLGGWLAERHGWSDAYLYIGIPNLALALVLFLWLRDPPREHLAAAAAPAEKPIRLLEAMRSLAKPGPYHYFLACQAVQGGVSWIIIGWIPTLMREQFKMAQGAAGFSSLGFLYGLQMGGLLLGGFVSDRLSVRNPHSRIIIPAVAVMITAPVVLATGGANSVALILVSLGMWGLAMGFLGANNMPIVCLTVDPRFRASAVGIMNCCTAIFGGISIYGVGALRDAKMGLAAIMAITAAGVFLCGFLLWMVSVSLKRRPAVVEPAPAL